MVETGLGRIRGRWLHSEYTGLVFRDIKASILKGSSTSTIRTLVPNTIKSMISGIRNLLYWLLGPSGYHRL